MAVAAAISACSPSGAQTANDVRVDYGLLDSTPAAPIDYEREIRPLLENRCVVCHGCYDAPCQLKLSSFAGIERGGSKEVVYDGARIRPADPTRLFIDALTSTEWRRKGFHPVLAEGSTERSDRLDRSLLYRMLRLKQLHPQPLAGRIDPSIDTGLDRKAMCPRLDEFDEYAHQHPAQGMPFAFPNLSADEYETLVHWLAQGTPRGPEAPVPSALAEQMEAWERFLNGTSLKQRLVARYLYEHLFQAHLHFEESDARTFFALLRSRTPPGQPIVPVATRRPYGDPEGAFFYRIRPLEESAVAKSHVVYELSAARMARLEQLFFTPDYAVSALPSYEPAIAANPFRAFAALPIESRYRFLLDDARFFVEGFIKGPVCRGQIALNVIEDRFWILFFDPGAPLATNTRYVDQLAHYLSQPNEMEDNLRLVTTYERYLNLENQYLEARRQVFQPLQPWPLERAGTLLWNGEGKNRNAALTVYRHYDSASVDTGLVGDPPLTSWVVDYPLLERIHYLLVAGFDVYGNVGHQLNTRLFMDVLRMEAEEYFLAFLPSKIREQTHDAWYTGIRSGDARDVQVWWANIDFVTGYRTPDPQRELYQHFAEWLGPLAKSDVHRPCDGKACGSDERQRAVENTDRALAQLGQMRGAMMQYLPDVAFVRVKLDGALGGDLAYSLIVDKGYHNVSSMFSEQKPGDERDTSADRQTVLPWLEGSYPEFFFVVAGTEVERFVDQYSSIRSREDARRFLDRFGMRRTNPRFWETSDWFNAEALREQPERGGIFDLNRYWAL